MIRIKNWEKFQHYSDRDPAWIKLYRKLLDDIEWHKLDPLSTKVLIMLWLLGSEENGNLPHSKEISFRLRMPEKQIKSCVSKLSHWLEHVGSDVASNDVADCFRENIDLEREYKEEKIADKRRRSFTLPNNITTETWAAFEEHRRKMRRPMTDRARNLIANECEKIGGDPNKLLEQSIMNGWQGVFPLKGQPVKETIAPKKECLCGKQGKIQADNRYYCHKCWDEKEP